MRRAFPTMGTVASVFAPDAESGPELRAAEAIVERMQDAFEDIEQRFSLYRDDSEASRIARGELLLTHASPEMREAYGLAVEWREATGGAFTPRRPDGVIDLAGVVKALAIEEGGRLLDEGSLDAWILNIGGDVLVRGGLDGVAWRAGIVDPANRGTLLGSVALPPERRALATSGIAERGEHVWRAADGGPGEFAQVTVRADGIVEADVLATAILAGGQALLDDLVRDRGIDVLACAREGAMLATPGMRAALAQRAA